MKDLKFIDAMETEEKEEDAKEEKKKTDFIKSVEDSDDLYENFQSLVDHLKE